MFIWYNKLHSLFLLTAQYCSLSQESVSLFIQPDIESILSNIDLSYSTNLIYSDPRRFNNVSTSFILSR